MKTLNRKKLTLLTLVVALGVAVYLNWQYARTAAPGYGLAAASDAALQTAAEPDSLAAGTAPSTSGSEAPLGDKNYGDAQLVSLSAAGNGKYFDQARLTRSQTRDEALDTLQKSLKSAKLSEEEKKALTDQLSGIITSIAAEGEIETMVKAKGFVDCVAFLDGGRANLTVQTPDGQLSADQVAQIRDIVVAKASVPAHNITIVEVK